MAVAPLPQNVWTPLKEMKVGGPPPPSAVQGWNDVRISAQLNVTD
jgi:hypothetical protein